MSTNCPDRPDSARFIAGCMTGTSLDGLDVALAEVRGRGVDLEAKLLGTIGRPLDDVRGPLLDLARGAAAPPINYLRAGRRLGELHADAIAALCARDLAHGATLDFVTAHGQTIWHAPDERLSWQLLDPWPIVRRLGVPVCHDLRQADLIAGGQGAPITPVADAILYRDAGTATIVNLGGICNVTELDPAAPRGVRGGRDIGPCNLLIDGVVQRLFPAQQYDENGRIGRSGRPDDAVRGWLVAHPYFAEGADRSTGREDFDDAWLNGVVARASTTMAPADVVASAVDATAWLIADRCAKRAPETQPNRLILAGGGALNPLLVERLAHHCNPVEVVTSDAMGVPAHAREALGIAVLGALCADGVAITLPVVTGADHPGRSGAWAYPGRED